MAVPTVIPTSTVVARDATPTKSTDVWGLYSVVRPSWNDRQVVRSSFEGSVQSARSGDEQRRGWTDRPTIGFQSPSVMLGRRAINEAETYLMRRAQARGLCPLWPDTLFPETRVGPDLQRHQSAWWINGTFFVEGAAGAGTDFSHLPADRGHELLNRRRFFPGMRVLVWNREDPTEWAVRTISAMSAISTSRGLALSSSVPFLDTPFDYRPSMAITPLIEANVQLAQPVTYDTDEDATAVLEGVSWPGEHGLSVRVEKGDYLTAAFYGTGLSGVYPIFPDRFVDYAQKPSVDVVRTGNLVPSHIESIPSLYDAHARMRYSLIARCFDRERYMTMRALWEYAGGRLHPWFLISPVAHFDLASDIASGNQLVLRAWGTENAWDHRQYIGVVYRDGTQIVREIDSVVRTGSEGTGTDTVTCDGVFDAASISDVKRVAVARLVRFANEEIEELWFNYEACDIRIACIDYQDPDYTEDDSYLVNTTDPRDSTSGFASAYDPTACSTVI